MKCPECGHKTRILETRMVCNGNILRRRRICDDCNKRYTTYEVWGDSYPGVDIKRLLR